MLTRAHFQYLKLENEVTIEVLAGRLSKREADHKLRRARQVLGYLTVEPSSLLAEAEVIRQICRMRRSTLTKQEEGQ